MTGIPRQLVLILLLTQATQALVISVSLFRQNILTERIKGNFPKLIESAAMPAGTQLTVHSVGYCDVAEERKGIAFLQATYTTAKPIGYWFILLQGIDHDTYSTFGHGNGDYLKTLFRDVSVIDNANFGGEYNSYVDAHIDGEKYEGDWTTSGMSKTPPKIPPPSVPIPQPTETKVKSKAVQSPPPSQPGKQNQQSECRLGGQSHIVEKQDIPTLKTKAEDKSISPKTLPKTSKDTKSMTGDVLAPEKPRQTELENADARPVVKKKGCFPCCSNRYAVD